MASSISMMGRGCAAFTLNGEYMLSRILQWMTKYMYCGNNVWFNFIDRNRRDFASGYMYKSKNVCDNTSTVWFPPCGS